MGTTPEQAMEIIHERFGAHERHRALHAKGVHLNGTFTATPEASNLSKAAFLNGSPVTCNVRLSNGGGDPNVPDYVPDVRGLAVAFNVGDERFDLLAQTIPKFPFKDQEGFFALMKVSKPSLSSAIRFPLFAVRYPQALKGFREAQARLNEMKPFAARRYFTFHAYAYVDADGSRNYVRHSWLPTVDEPSISRSEAKERGRDWLFEELRDRLTREPIRMTLEAQVAAEGDNPDDPSNEWPSTRDRVTLGTLEITAIDEGADDAIIYDPARTVDGVGLSKDPVLNYRPAVYGLSFGERTG